MTTIKLLTFLFSSLIINLRTESLKLFSKRKLNLETIENGYCSTWLLELPIEQPRRQQMKQKIISAVYKIMNTVTGDFYIGSSRNVKRRWAVHKCPSTWKHYPNKPLYKDMQKYGVDKFMFQILVPVMPEYLTQVEQEYIEMLNPTYNKNNAKGWNVEEYKEANRKYKQSEKYKETIRKYYQSEKGKEAIRKYQQSEKYKKYIRKYQQSEKYKEYEKKYHKKYYSKLCEYNGETLTLKALICRFQRAGIEHATLEAKKYLIITTQKQIETE